MACRADRCQQRSLGSRNWVTGKLRDLLRNTPFEPHIFHDHGTERGTRTRVTPQCMSEYNKSPWRSVG
jgi:hypothetical protein